MKIIVFVNGRNSQHIFFKRLRRANYPLTRPDQSSTSYNQSNRGKLNWVKVILYDNNFNTVGIFASHSLSSKAKRYVVIIPI